MTKILALKIDVDTERGTRVGVKNLLDLFDRINQDVAREIHMDSTATPRDDNGCLGDHNAIEATFLFSLGPDNTGRALKRIFRPGFFKKVSRTSVISTYGIKTILNGVLWPGPHIAKRHAGIMRETEHKGHEVGIHSYDHCAWQDYVNKWSKARVSEEFQKAREAFKMVFNKEAQTAGTAGWQANANSLAAYDDAALLYGSDCRGTHPFIPRIDGTTFNTPQFPSTLPTLDELIGRPEYPLETITDHLLSQLSDDQPNVFTMHAELEGMKYLTWFESFCRTALNEGVIFKRMDHIAKDYLATQALPVCDFIQAEVDGRSGFVSVQA